MNFEELILSIVNGIADANYNMLGAIVAVISIIFWLVVTSWIWVDSDERSTSKWMRLFYVLIGLIPIVGWIIYLIVRPPETIDEIYWGDLERRYLKYEAKDLGDCPRCGTQLFPGFVYCPNCKKRLKRKCSKCEVYVELEYKYCPHCGNQMATKPKKEAEISQEEMQKQIDETKEEAHETVKSKKSKYKQEQNFITRVGQSVIRGYKLIGKKISDFLKSQKDNIVKKKGNTEGVKESEQQGNKKSKEKKNDNQK
jgi:uncharacterized Zn finger protein (UPF0148 family)